MKNRVGKIILIIILSIICILLLGIMVFALINRNNAINLKLFSNQTKLIYEKEMEIEELNDLKINVSSSDVIIKESTDGKIKIDVYGAEGEIVTEKLENNILEITEENNLIILFGMWIDNRVEVYMPKDYEKELHINTTSGDINAIDLENSNVTMQASSGDITCGNMLYGNLQTSSGDITAGNSVKTIIQTSSGEIKIGEVEEIEASTSSGEIEISKGNRVTAKSTSGDITIGEINGYSKIKSNSGRVKISKFSINENSEIETTSGDVSLENNSDIYFETESNSGSINVEKSNRLSEIVCKIKTTSGNINVN